MKYKDIITRIEFSDKSWNVFMAHEKKVIDQFIKRKIELTPGLTFNKKDMSREEFDKLMRYK
jgi:hypothetical protein